MHTQFAQAGCVPGLNARMLRPPLYDPLGQTTLRQQNAVGLLVS